MRGLGIDTHALGYDASGSVTGRLPELPMAPAAFGNRTAPALSFESELFPVVYADDVDGAGYNALLSITGLSNVRPASNRREATTAGAGAASPGPGRCAKSRGSARVPVPPIDRVAPVVLARTPGSR